jgi:hypothetical protein
VILSAPGLLFSGWQLIFNSSVWTETYRELKAYEMIKATPLPVVAPKPAPRPRQVTVKPVSVKPAPASTTAVKKTTAKVTPAKPSTKAKTTPK